MKKHKRKRIKMALTDLSGRKNIIVVDIPDCSDGDEQLKVFKKTFEGNYRKLQSFTDSCIQGNLNGIPTESNYEQIIENMKEQNNLLKYMLEQRRKEEG